MHSLMIGSQPVFSGHSSSELHDSPKFELRSLPTQQRHPCLSEQTPLAQRPLPKQGGPQGNTMRRLHRLFSHKNAEDGYMRLHKKLEGLDAEVLHLSRTRSLHWSADEQGWEDRSTHIPKDMFRILSMIC
mmetsp:Transcript_11384/g.19483  ORF Transcript_11384/g.19483 Transcript_11384/m.19483 type:complete len:130 (-) Transcript_11384:353-742(-)